MLEDFLKEQEDVLATMAFDRLFNRLKERIPTGFAKHNRMLPETKEF